MILFDETSTVVKSPPANAGDAGSIPSLERFRCLGANNLCPVTAEPVLQSPGAAPTEPSCCNHCSPCTLELVPLERKPCSVQVEKVREQQQRPSTTKKQIDF